MQEAELRRLEETAAREAALQKEKYEEEEIRKKKLEEEVYTCSVFYFLDQAVLDLCLLDWCIGTFIRFMRPVSVFLSGNYHMLLESSCDKSLCGSACCTRT